MSTSEVARIVHQIDLEYQARKRALTAVTRDAVRYDFIQTNPQTIAKYADRRVMFVEVEQALAVITPVIWTPVVQGTAQ